MRPRRDLYDDRRSEFGPSRARHSSIPGFAVLRRLRVYPFLFATFILGAYFSSYIFPPPPVPIYQPPNYDDESDWKEVFLPPDAPPLSRIDDDGSERTFWGAQVKQRRNDGDDEERSGSTMEYRSDDGDPFGTSLASGTSTLDVPAYFSELDGYLYYPAPAPSVAISIPRIHGFSLRGSELDELSLELPQGPDIQAPMPPYPPWTHPEAFFKQSDKSSPRSADKKPPPAPAVQAQQQLANRRAPLVQPPIPIPGRGRAELARPPAGAGPVAQQPGRGANNRFREILGPDGRPLGPNAAAMVRAERDNRPFVPGTPPEILAERQALREQAKRKADQLNAKIVPIAQRAPVKADPNKVLGQNKVNEKEAQKQEAKRQAAAQVAFELEEAQEQVRAREARQKAADLRAAAPKAWKDTGKLPPKAEVIQVDISNDDDLLPGEEAEVLDFSEEDDDDNDDEPLTEEEIALLMADVDLDEDEDEDEDDDDATDEAGNWAFVAPPPPPPPLPPPVAPKRAGVVPKQKPIPAPAPVAAKPRKELGKQQLRQQVNQPPPAIKEQAKPQPKLPKVDNPQPRGRPRLADVARQPPAKLARGGRQKRSFVDVEAPSDESPPTEGLEVQAPLAAPVRPLPLDTTSSDIHALTSTLSSSLPSPAAESAATPLVDLRKRAFRPDDNEPLSIAEDDEETSPPPSLSSASGRIHPITFLMYEAEKAWKAMLRRQSQSLTDAVEEYQRRYGRRPPRGFDRWWRYAMQNRVILVDEYDQINDDIEPLLAFSSRDVKQRAALLSVNPAMPFRADTFSIEVRDGKSSAAGAQRFIPRVEDVEDIMSEFVEVLPDVMMIFVSHNLPVVPISGELRVRNENFARHGMHLAKSQQMEILENRAYPSWSSLCHPNSTARRVISGEVPAGTPFAPSFISLDHSAAMDLCHHPEIQYQHGFTAWEGPKPHLLFPVFAWSKTSMHGDMILPSMDGYYAEVGADPAWEKKKHNKIVWRGKSTGTYRQDGRPWRSSQRDRLVTLASAQVGERDVRYADSEAGDVLRRFSGPAKDINGHYFDVAFAGPPVQCDREATLCDWQTRTMRFTASMTKGDQNQYKYSLDVDGNGPSIDFHRLMSSNSVVFKSTIFEEWWTKRIIPWYHYVPVKNDYSDLTDIAAFFIGAPDGRGAHDAAAKKIAQNGKKWANEHWREVDMAAYQFRMYLEYARVVGRTADDSWDFIME